MGVFLEGVQSDTVTTAAGQILTKTYTVAVADGQLNLRLIDLGGFDPNTVIEGLDIVLGRFRCDWTASRGGHADGNDQRDGGPCDVDLQRGHPNGHVHLSRCR